MILRFASNCTLGANPGFCYNSTSRSAQDIYRQCGNEFGRLHVHLAGTRKQLREMMVDCTGIAGIRTEWRAWRNPVSLVLGAPSQRRGRSHLFSPEGALDQLLKLIMTGENFRQ